MERGQSRWGSSVALPSRNYLEMSLGILLVPNTCKIQGFPGGTSGKKNLPANAGDIRDVGIWPLCGEWSPRGGQGKPLQHPCLANLMDRGSWRAAVRGVAESDRTEATNTHACVCKIQEHRCKRVLLVGGHRNRDGPDRQWGPRPRWLLSI